MVFQRKRLLTILSAYLFMGGALFLWVYHVQAVPASNTAFNITTSPVYSTVVIKPGTTTTRELKVLNNTTKAVPIKTSLDPFAATGVTGQAAILKPTPQDTFLSWVHFSPSTFVAQPGVWNSITMTISVPPTATLGYYYAVLFTPANTPAGTSPTTTTITGANAILVLVDTQSANESRRLQVSSFIASHHVYEYLPASFTVTVQNIGNIYIPPRGEVYISRTPTGRPLTALDINPGQGNVLPNSSRNFTVSWSDGFPAFTPKLVNGQTVTVKGQLVEQLNWNFSHVNRFRFGRYYAKLVLVYNNGTTDVPVTALLSFWVVPWKLLFVLTVIATLLLIGLFTVGRILYRKIRGPRPPFRRLKTRP